MHVDLLFVGFGWFVCFWMDLVGFDHCLFVPVSFDCVLVILIICCMFIEMNFECFSLSFVCFC